LAEGGDHVDHVRRPKTKESQEQRAAIASSALVTGHSHIGAQCLHVLNDAAQQRTQTGAGQPTSSPGPSLTRGMLGPLHEVRLLLYARPKMQDHLSVYPDDGVMLASVGRRRTSLSESKMSSNIISLIG
jgi:hypothetical protein